MNERFDEQFGGQKFVYANERTLLPFIQQEIDLDRKRIVERIKDTTFWKVCEAYFPPEQREYFITLITNNK